jgi:hypothetical protein
MLNFAGAVMASDLMVLVVVRKASSQSNLCHSFQP